VPLQQSKVESSFMTSKTFIILTFSALKKDRLPHFGEETADFRIKHGFKIRGILAFPNSLQPLAYPPE
jgi:hypothetical protein